MPKENKISSTTVMNFNSVNNKTPAIHVIGPEEESKARTADILDMANGQRRKDSFLDLQLVFMKFGGILSPKGEKKTWKHTIYNAYCLMIIIWCPPSMLAQIVGLVAVIDDIEAMTEILFEFVSALNTFTCIVYLMTRREQVHLIIEKVYDEFRDCTSNFNFTTKHYNIILAAAKRNVKYSRTVMSLVSMSSIMWIIRPVINRSVYELKMSELTSEEIELRANTTQEIHWDLFCHRMWLPENPMEPKRYMLIWIFQIFPSFLIAMSFIGYNTLYYALTLFLSAHFEILIQFLRNINDITENDALSEPQNDKSKHLNKVPEKIDGTDLKETFSKMLHLRQAGNTSTEKEDQLTTKTDEFHYLCNCIKYHQALLSLCEDVERLFSPLFFMFFFCNAGAMCTTIFRATMVKNDENFVKFFFAFLSVWFSMYMLCSCGEMVTSQSIEVQNTTYCTNWYHSSRQVKKLLKFVIMRSQKPVRFTAGKMIPVNLEGFSAIANNVYALFTILKRMQEE